MKLYYSPGACSFAPHIAAVEAGIPVTLVKVDLRSHKVSDASDFYTVNLKGYVPVLELDDGTKLTEAAVVLQYLADRNPGKLAPAFGSMERYRLMEWLNFVATELHKGMGALWNPSMESVRGPIMEKIGKRLDFLAAALTNRQFLHGDSFTIADAYLFTILSWAKPLKVDLSRWPAITSYIERIGARPAVQQAKRAESGG
ncbi:MAG TPA: glutathione transferase GstA [Casimicrobiaceae bacterium]|nr:glutathione transferase GstA [Casimicrobiaceae bacterium]